MGLRGPGTGKAKQARDAAPARPRKMPWEFKGLTRVQRVIRFLEWLPVTKGILAGKRMKLLPDQREFIEAVYGRVGKDGRRQVTLAVKSAPKGNGKTGLSAGLALCHLCGPEAEPRGEVYSASIDGTHARKMYREMEAIVLQRPALASRLNLKRFNSTIEVLNGAGNGSTYEAMSADGRKAQGLAPSLWIYDELAQVSDRELLEGLQEGMGKRKEALGIIISTQARDDMHSLSQIIDDGLRGDDPSTFVHLIAAPAEADAYDEAVLRACNPAWGHYLDLEDLRRSMIRAQRIPAYDAGYRNLRLNQRVDSSGEDRIVTAAVWKQGNVPVDREALTGRTCFGALDLSGKHDLTSLTLVFPSDEAEPRYDILPFFWTPEGQLAGRRKAEQERFRQWISEGFIEAVPGPTIRYGFVAEQLIQLADEFDIAVIGFDRWRIDDFKLDLFDADADFAVPLEEFGQGYQSMSPAIELFAELALTGRLRHGGNPVLTAAVANAITISDATDSVKIHKPKSHHRGPVRVDGAVTLCMALDLAKRFQPSPPIDIDDFLLNAVAA